MIVEITNINRRDQQEVEAKKVKITIGEIDYRITEGLDGELCINKFSIEDTVIKITPRVSNEIYIK